MDFFPLVNDIVHAHLTRKPVLKSSTSNSKAYIGDGRSLVLFEMFTRDLHFYCISCAFFVHQSIIFVQDSVIAGESMTSPRAT